MKGTHLPQYDGRLQIMVEQSDADAVRTAAKAEDRSVNQWCRQAIKAALRQRGIEPKAA